MNETEQAAVLGEAVDLIDRLVEEMIWMSGSPSFGDGGEAEDHWVSIARPTVFEAIAWLEVVQGDD